MKLEHPELERFEPILQSAFRLAFTGGLERLQSDGFKLEDIETNVRARKRFVRACHYGYDKAQRFIGAEVIRTHERIEIAKADLKKLRVARNLNAKRLIELIRILELRLLVLRRVADGILYTIFSQETWVLRRLIVDDHIRPVQPTVLARTIEIASKLNAQDRSNFYVVSDLTTVVQIGDLIEQNIKSTGSRKWRVIELKEGKINELLVEKFGNRDAPLTEIESKEIRTSIGEKGLKQASRIIRQTRRSSNLEQILNTDQGVDEQSGSEMLVTPEMFQTDDYLGALWSTVDRAKQKGLAATSIDKCLCMVAVREDRFAKLGIGGVAHLLYHHRNRGVSCAFATGDSSLVYSEREAIEREPRFIDLVEQNIRGQWGLPLTIGRRDKVIELLMGRIRIFLQFDLQAFMTLASEAGINLKISSDREIDESRKKLHLRIPDIFGTVGIKGVTMDLSDDLESTLTSGFFGRLMMDFTRPEVLVEMLRRDRHQAEQLSNRMRLTKAGGAEKTAS